MYGAVNATLCRDGVRNFAMSAGFSVTTKRPSSEISWSEITLWSSGLPRLLAKRVVISARRGSIFLYPIPKLWNALCERRMGFTD